MADKEDQVKPEELSIDEKRRKIESNYEVIGALKARLQEVKERQSKGMTRAAYIRMIFDVTKKVDNQNSELRKIIMETRKLQKDISSQSGRLDRCFTLVEEKILRVCLFSYDRYDQLIL